MIPLNNFITRSRTVKRKALLLGSILLISTFLLVAWPGLRRVRAVAFQSSDLGIIKSAPATVSAGANLTYTITVVNNGPDNATGASWTDPLPAGTTFVSVSSVMGWTCSDPGVGKNGTVICSNSSFPQESDTFSLVVNVTAVGGTNLVNQVTVSSETPDENPENNTSAAGTVVSGGNAADVGVTKTGPSQTLADKDVTYTITVTNFGPNPALNVSLTDTLPDSVPSGNPMSFVSFTKTSGPAWNCGSPSATTTCTIASLPVGSSSFSFVGHVPPSAPVGAEYTNQAFISSDNDPNSENDSSPAATQVVDCSSIQFFFNPIVTTNADSGAGSLRQAITDACVGSTITFDMSQFTGPITLTSGVLTISKSLTIQGPGANQLTVSGNNLDRVFFVNSGLAVAISDLTIANGKTSNKGGGLYNLATLSLANVVLSGNNADSSGGGILNDITGTLTLTNSIVSGNNAGLTVDVGGGGGIQSLGTMTLSNSIVSGNSAAQGGGIDSEGATFNLTNSTVSGNNATLFGGGIIINSGPVTLLNSTITNNRCDSHNSGGQQGGGIAQVAGIVTLNNTIVAGNFRGTGTTRDDVFGALGATSSFNLIGDGTNMTGISNGSNGNQIGSSGSPINALLGPLANNGGPTQTHALLPGSPALDAGSNTLATNAGLTTDQRGFSRFVDSPDADAIATVDIGAYEAQVGIEDITDKITNEDTQLQFTFNVGGNPNPIQVTATSSNITLVPNVPANLSVSLSGASRTLTINPAANQFGTTTITVTVSNGIENASDSFLLTVNPVPDTPSVTNATTTVNTQTTSGLVITRNPADGAEVTNFKITNITGGTLFKNNGTSQINNNDFITVVEGNAGLKFTPVLNSNANGSFQVQASLNNTNAGLGGGLATATITVNCGPTVVTNSNDTGAGSLRSTILTACPGATLTFDMSAGQVTSPINLTSGELVVDKSLAIQGAAANVLTIQRSPAAGTFRVFNVTVNSGGVAISGLTISNGNTTSNGGGISNTNNATLTLTGDVVSNNTAQFGGGVFSFGTGTVTVVNSTINGNNATSSGGGLYSNGVAIVNIANSTLSGNSARAGGGLFNVQGHLNIVNVTINNNSAPGVSGAGGGIYNNSPTAFAAAIGNTIVAGNTAGTANGPDIQGAAASLGNNLIGAKDGSSGLTNGVNNDIVGTIANPVNPLLAALGNYGGTTPTLALLPGSPAINAGSNTVANNAGLTTDQRGAGFNRIVGTNVDIGAFESRGFTLSIVSGTPQNTTILTAFGSPLVTSLTGVGLEPVNGGIVTFTAPASGASAGLSGGGNTTNVTVASGQASAIATANGTAGGPYNVTAAATGATSVNFALTNNQAATTTTLASSVNPSDLNQNVTFTATVSSVGIPTGAVQFKDNGSNIGGPVSLNPSGVALVTTSTLTTGNHVITAAYSGDANLLASSGTLPGGQTVLFRPLIKFSQPNYSVNENGNFITITVVRSGDTSQAVTVDYTTPDDSAAVTFLPCSNANGVGSPRCDFTTALGTLKFGPGETSKTFTVLISQDTWVEGNETVALTLSNPTGGAAFQQPSDANAVLMIVDDDLTPPTTNAIDDSNNFVRQHYHDFLNREPDAPGFSFWTNQIESCGADAQCRAARRVNVSAAFFLSIEFQNTGYFVERMYKAGFGDINPPTVPVPIRFTNFLVDTKQVQGDVIVGVGNWQAQLDANKKAFALAFVQRTAFLNRYPALTSATAFVDSLNANAGMVLSDAERSALIAELSANPADPTLRADVLQKVAENQTLQQREFNRAFVLMEYFGYLRRNPDAAPEPGLNFNGYNFWVNKLNQFNGDYIGAEVIKAFITSGEYRGRFGP